MGSVNDAFGETKKSGVWCRIAGGKVVRSAKAETPGAIKVERTDKDGKGTGEFSYQVQSGSVTGFILKHGEQVDTFEGNEVRKLVVHLRHPSAGDINMTIKEGDRYWHAYMNMLPNADMGKPITFEPYDYVNKNGDRKIGLGMKQDDKELAYKYTKGSPDGPPELQPIMLANGKPLTKNGKTQYDWEPIIEWHKANTLMEAEARILQAVHSLPAPVTPHDSITSDPQAEYERAPLPVAENEIGGSGLFDDDDSPL